MAESMPRAIRTIPVTIASPCLAPWMRFGMVDSRAASPAENLAQQRVLHDFCLHLQLEKRSWVWCECLQGSLDVEPGDLLFIPPGFVHAWAYVGETHLAIHFDLQHNPALTPRNYDYSYDMITPLEGVGVRRPVEILPVFEVIFGDESHEVWRIPLITRVSHLEVWHDRLDDLVYRWQTRKLETPSSQLRVMRMLSWALEELTLRSSDAPSLIDDPKIGALVREMHAPDRLAELSQLSVTALAHHVGMGVTSFRTRFRALTSCTPHQFIRERQMEHAAYLLRNTTQSVRMIAAGLGFDDPYHFSRVFHQMMGSAPTDFRRREHGHTDP